MRRKRAEDAVQMLRLLAERRVLEDERENRAPLGVARSAAGLGLGKEDLRGTVPRVLQPPRAQPHTVPERGSFGKRHQAHK